MSDPKDSGAMDGGSGSSLSVFDTDAAETAPSSSSLSNTPNKPTPASSTDSPQRDDGSATETNIQEKKPSDRVPIVEKDVDVQKEEHDNKLGEPRWNSSATLYCPKNGHLHSNLLSFGINDCPACSQSLGRVSPKPISPSRSHHKHKLDKDKQDAEEKEDMTINKPEDKSERGQSEESGPGDGLDPISKHLNVAHTVDYRDSGGYSITSEDWPHPFHLERERNTAFGNGLTRKKNIVFGAITVLRTSIPADPRRMSWEKRAILEAGPLLGNPKLSISIMYTAIKISSRLFIDALKSVVSYDTDVDLDIGTLELNEPFALISHHLEELEDYVRLIGDKVGTHGGLMSGEVGAEALASVTAPSEANLVERETRAHVRVVLDHVTTIVGSHIAQERARHRRDTPTCTYPMLWYLFRPGLTVYVISDEAEDAYVVESVKMEKFSLSSLDHAPACLINLWYLEFNGEFITRAQHQITIEPFKGERSIISLDVVPCDVFDRSDGGKLCATLEARGKKWVDHLQGRQVEYIGEPFKLGRQTITGRAYAHPASYYGMEDKKPEFNPVNTTQTNESKTPRTLASRYDNVSIKKFSSLASDWGRFIGYLLCSRTLKAFVFGTRTWETLDIRYCQPVKPDTNPFSRLVMPKERKLMIKALVYKYTDPRYAGGSGSQVWGADFIKNKGEGQIFLLHGGPGVGKTFTAECIAEFTGRPLLSLTCGDIGTEEVGMEKKLRYWLSLAYRWGAVMLIDEADVFLEKRQDTDFKRNSLVSVFLREIEYYQGILFLTSNRVGKFDDAIVSRIHVVIHYKALDEEYREKIWNQFFDKLESERGATMKIERSARRYVLENKKLAEMKWNGREIRNAFQTAVALAEYRFLVKPEAEKEAGEIAVLEEEDFKQICDMTLNFKKYLREVNEGQDEEMRALLDKARGKD